jgi:hypothetical protein
MQSLINSSPIEELNQINPNIGNSKGLSNTFHRAIPDLLRPYNINNNNSDNNINTVINTQVTAA